MAEEEKKPSRREAMYGKKEEKAEHESPAEEKSEGSAGEHKEAQTPDAESQAEDVPARHATERAALYKKHRDEHRDLHGNHRGERDQMHARHDAEHKALNERHMQEAGRGEAAVAGDTPGGEGGAEGGAGEVPQAKAA